MGLGCGWGGEVRGWVVVRGEGAREGAEGGRGGRLDVPRSYLERLRYLPRYVCAYFPSCAKREKFCTPKICYFDRADLVAMPPKAADNRIKREIEAGKQLCLARFVSPLVKTEPSPTDAKAYD